MKKLETILANEAESLEFARLFAKSFAAAEGFKSGMIFYLKGDLGAGKSFFSRAFIQYFLPEQKVKSPTYTIVETYNFSINALHHLDLYRLCDPEELEYLAVRDLFSENFVALIEWPQKGKPVLPPADIEIEFVYLGGESNAGRRVEIRSLSPKAIPIMKLIEQGLTG